MRILGENSDGSQEIRLDADEACLVVNDDGLVVVCPDTASDQAVLSLAIAQTALTDPAIRAQCQRVIEDGDD